MTNHVTCCDCSECLGDANCGAVTDPQARLWAQRHVALPRTLRRAQARRLMLDDLERTPDDRRTKKSRVPTGPVKRRLSIERMSASQLDQLERQISRGAK